MITPIQTYYDGHYFRSRIEARWAVFFNKMGIPYDYEREGYELDGKPYLADFWLPEQNYWIEIKGQFPTEDEQQKARNLATATGHDVFIFWGKIPLPKHFIEEFCTDEAGLKVPKHDGNWGNGRSALAFFARPKKFTASENFHETITQDYSYWWTECEDCGLVGIQFEGRDARLPCSCSSEGNHGIGYASKRLLAAYTAARQARFDRGKKGI
ncbi:MAG TPA: hypothetical protein VEX60_07425 [Pyrinomonadaceae bacterium]|nr:hypothetical protein [Pyrinomonadaceae bacterium]